MTGKAAKMAAPHMESRLPGGGRVAVYCDRRFGRNKLRPSRGWGEASRRAARRIAATTSRVLLYYSQQQITMHVAEEQIEEKRHDRWVVSDDVYVLYKNSEQRLACVCPYAETIMGNASEETRCA